MFENIHQPLLSRMQFIIRIMRSLFLGVLLIGIGLFAGMLGYHHYESMSWVDAFVNAAMILSGMGPIGTFATTGGKIFAGFYALFSGLGFIIAMGVIFSPVIHRFFHAMHLGDNNRG